MTYTEATILEIQRITNVVPVDGRTNTADYRLGKYNIPKGHLAVLNLYAMHMNPETWSEPRQFRPERFLDAENNIVNAHKILPFGLGKRVCIGEPMARFTIFVYFTALLQKYTFSVVPGKRTPSPLDPLAGVTLSPKPYSALIKQRQ
jgi:cytochrome P450